jgi:hypothetical protein
VDEFIIEKPIDIRIAYGALEKKQLLNMLRCIFSLRNDMLEADKERNIE